MAQKEFTEEELLKAGAAEPEFSEEDLMNQGAVPLELPKAERMLQELKQIGSDVGSAAQTGFDAVGDLIKYTDAPLKETAMIPKRVYESGSLEDIGNAILEPIKQIGQSGEDAPEWNQVYSEYGVPTKQESGPALSGAINMLQGPNIPMGQNEPDSYQMPEITPEQASNELPGINEFAGGATEMLVGGKGLEGAASAGKFLAKNAAKGMGAVSDFVTGSNMVSNLGRQAVQTVKDTGEEVADIFKKFANPKLVNTKIAHEGEDANIIKEMFPDGDVPNAIKYTKDSEIVKMENKLRGADYGGEIAKKHNSAIEKAYNYVLGQAQKIASRTKLGRPLESRQAGEYLIQKYNDMKTAIINSADITRAKAVNALKKPEQPGIIGMFNKVMGDDGYPKISTQGLGRIRKTADALKERVSKLTMGKNNPVAEQLAELKLIVDDASNITSIGELEAKIKTVANLAFNIDSPFNPQDKRSLEKLYFAMTDAFTDTIRTTMGEDKAAELIKNNEKLSKFFKSTSEIDTYLANRSANKLPAEGAFTELIEKANSTELKQIAENFNPEDLDVIRSSYLNAKLSGKNLHITDENIYIPKWKAMINDLQKDQTFKILFKPEEQDRIISALKIGEDLGSPIVNKNPTLLGGMKDRVLLNPAIKRHVNVMENGAPVFDQSGAIGAGRDLLKTGLIKQNVVDEFAPPMMTPEQRIQMIDADPSLSPSQRASEKQKVWSGK